MLMTQAGIAALRCEKAIGIRDVVPHAAADDLVRNAVSVVSERARGHAEIPRRCWPVLLSAPSPASLRHDLHSSADHSVNGEKGELNIFLQLALTRGG